MDAATAYTARMQNSRPARLIFGISVLGLVLMPHVVLGGPVGKDFWVGGGVSWPDYREKAIACMRGGLGAVFFDHITLGISGHVDRERFHYFVDTSVISPPIGLMEVYGRFQIGRRDDRDDTAMGWAAGIRTGEDAIRVFVEGYSIFEPQENYGACVGISF